jgi:hypothetical protein
VASWNVQRCTQRHQQPSVHVGRWPPIMQFVGSHAQLVLTIRRRRPRGALEHHSRAVCTGASGTADATANRGTTPTQELDAILSIGRWVWQITASEASGARTQNMCVTSHIRHHGRNTEETTADNDRQQQTTRVLNVEGQTHRSSMRALFIFRYASSAACFSANPMNA